jgi:hypothetical protein
MSQGMGRLLCQDGCSGAVKAHLATGEAHAPLRALFTPHIREVLRRVDVAAGEEWSCGL